MKKGWGVGRRVMALGGTYLLGEKWREKCPPEDLESRFDGLTNKDGACWLWLGSRFMDGYGRITIAGKGRRAHRAAWEIWRGKITDGLFVCHRCDTKLCVNPSHLFLGTHADNMSDCKSKGRQTRLHGLANGQCRLTGEHVDHIRVILATRVIKQKFLAKLFGVGEAQISRIKSGHRRSHA